MRRIILTHDSKAAPRIGIQYNVSQCPVQLAEFLLPWDPTYGTSD